MIKEETLHFVQSDKGIEVSREVAKGALHEAGRLED